MKAYEIDFKEVKTYMNFYQTIIKAMGFPEWCGKNLDAIWDMLTWEVETPAIIYIKGLDCLPKDLKEKRELLLKVFNDAHDWYERYGKCLEIKIVD